MSKRGTAEKGQVQLPSNWDRTGVARRGTHMQSLPYLRLR